MNGNHRMLPRSCRTIMVIAAMVLLLSAVSHAQTSDGLITQTVDPTVSVVNDLTTDSSLNKVSSRRVPEPSATVLLLLGLSMIGFGSYCVERRQRRV